MRYYPLALDLQNKDILVVGAGKVGRRKLDTLALTPVRHIVVVDPAGLEPEYLASLQSACSRAGGLSPPVSRSPARACSGSGNSLEQRSFTSVLHVHKRMFVPDDLAGKHLVFAATGSPALNREIALLCAEKDILCNCASAPDAGDFFVPASCSLDDLTVTVSTDGKSPALARKLSKDLEAWLGKRYNPLLRVMGRLRPILLAQGLPPEQNALLLRSLVASPLASCLEQHKPDQARAVLAELLPAGLHASIDELLYEL